jgi:hypothetical protein
VAFIANDPDNKSTLYGAVIDAGILQNTVVLRTVQRGFYILRILRLLQWHVGQIPGRGRRQW